MLLAITHQGRMTLNTTAEDAFELGYLEAIIGAAVRVSAKLEVTRIAETYCAKLDTQLARKLE